MKLFGSSGIRAVFDRDLLNLAFRVGMAVGAEARNVVIGTDTRTTGGAMKHAVTAGLLAAGARCADAGITPTPTLACAAREFDAGVMLTASHNPPEYNGIKLLNPDGSSYGTDQQERIEVALVADSLVVTSWDTVAADGMYDGAVARHTERILRDMPQLPGTRIVVDAGGGAAVAVTPELLEKMGCEVVRLYCTHNGNFPRPAEPVAENLVELCEKVKETGAACGIAHDVDADRMMAVDETGRFITGDVMLALLASREGVKDVVTTLDASMAIDEMGLAVRRTPIGDTWVSEELRKGGDFGGETSGCWVFPEISLCPDGIYAAALIAAMASRNRLSEMADTVPSYPLRRGSVNGSIGPLDTIEKELAGRDVTGITRSDGLKISYADGWVLVRPSGTEPKVRLTAEATTAARADELYDRALAAVREVVMTGGSVR